jgi:hypothetical protein
MIWSNRNWSNNSYGTGNMKRRRVSWLFGHICRDTAPPWMQFLVCINVLESVLTTSDHRLMVDRSRAMSHWHYASQSVRLAVRPSISPLRQLPDFLNVYTTALRQCYPYHYRSSQPQRSTRSGQTGRYWYIYRQINLSWYQLPSDTQISSDIFQQWRVRIQCNILQQVMATGPHHRLWWKISGNFPERKVSGKFPESFLSGNFTKNFLEIFRVYSVFIEAFHQFS